MRQMGVYWPKLGRSKRQSRAKGVPVSVDKEAIPRWAHFRNKGEDYGRLQCPKASSAR